MNKFHIALILLIGLTYGDEYNPRCDFEKRTCYQILKSSLFWVPTDKGVAASGEQYLTLSGDGPEAVFELAKEVFYNGIYSVSFWFFMTNPDLGSLRMYLKRDGKLVKLLTSNSDLQPEWNEVDEDVEMLKGDQVAFVFVKNPAVSINSGVVGVDKIKITGRVWQCFGGDRSTCQGHKCSEFGKCHLSCDGQRLNEDGSMYKCKCRPGYTGVFCNANAHIVCNPPPSNCPRCSHSSTSMSGYICKDVLDYFILNKNDFPKTY